MRLAGIIVAICSLAAVMPAHASQDFYVCRELTDDVCTSFVAVLDGLASVEQLGLTGGNLALALGAGMGTVWFFALSGLALGRIVKGLSQALNGG